MTDEVLATQAFYDKEASTYDERWTKPGGARTFAVQRAIVQELCGGWRGLEVLEVGCGTGRFSELLLQVGARPVVLDLSFQMLKSACARLDAGADIRTRAAQGSIFALPLRAGTFDCALSINVFNHLGAPSQALSELARVLRPGGQLVVNFANSTSYFWTAARLIARRKKAMGQDVVSYWRARDEIMRLLANAGFRPLRVLGNVHVARSLDYPVLRNIIGAVDSQSRTSLLRFLAPGLYIACERRMEA